MPCLTSALMHVSMQQVSRRLDMDQTYSLHSTHQLMSSLLPSPAGSFDASFRLLLFSAGSMWTFWPVKSVHA